MIDCPRCAPWMRRLAGASNVVVPSATDPLPTMTHPPSAGRAPIAAVRVTFALPTLDPSRLSLPAELTNTTAPSATVPSLASTYAPILARSASRFAALTGVELFGASLPANGADRHSRPACFTASIAIPSHKSSSTTLTHQVSHRTPNPAPTPYPLSRAVPPITMIDGTVAEAPHAMHVQMHAAGHGRARRGVRNGAERSPRI